MQKFSLDHMPAESRVQLLQDNAEVEETTYFRPLAPEELDQRREQLADVSIDLHQLSSEVKDLVAGYKAKMKPLSIQVGTLLTEIKTKQVESRGTVYHLANHDIRIMETYDESGELIGTRRLRPDEKQRNIPFQTKTA